MIYHAHRRSGSDWGSLDDLDVTIRDATASLRKHRSEFDSIIVTGLSGVLVGTTVSLRLKKPLVVLRKECEDSHSARGQLLNVSRLGERVLFLDDFISDGETWRRTQSAVERVSSRVVARYLYRDDVYNEVTA